MLASITVDEVTTDAVAVQIPEVTALASPSISDHVGTWSVSLGKSTTNARAFKRLATNERKLEW